MKIRGLYAITDAELIPKPLLLSHIEQALRGGACIVQYRDKKSSFRQRLQQASSIKQLCVLYNVPLLINDDIELALQCGADGVHLGQRDTDIGSARAQLGAKAIIGITCHNSLELALLAEQQGADYVAFGRFFPSHTKPQAPQASLQFLDDARPLLQVPVVAIGGITVDNARQVIQRGADAIAVIHHLFSAEDIEHRAQQLSSAFHHI